VDNQIDNEKLIERLKKHPKIANRLISLLDVTENESGTYDIADDVEEKFIEEIRKMGAEVMESWATNQVQKKIDEVCQDNKNLIRHSKKNFIGKQRLVPSK
jgi:hypothetical protein